MDLFISANINEKNVSFVIGIWVPIRAMIMFEVSTHFVLQNGLFSYIIWSTS